MYTSTKNKDSYNTGSAIYLHINYEYMKFCPSKLENWSESDKPDIKQTLHLIHMTYDIEYSYFICLMQT